MAETLKNAWWVLLLRGIVAILFALLLLFAPGLTLATGIFSFVVLFAIYLLVDGFSTIFGAVANREGQWFWMLIWGIISVLAGIAALGSPLLFGVFTLTVMIYIVAFRSIFSGIVEMFSAWQLRQEVDNEWLLVLNGLLSLLFGIILFIRPITGVEVLVLITSFYLLIAGVVQIFLAFKVRGWSNALGAKNATAE